MMPRILKYIGYLALFAICFLIFLYWMFPYEILKDRVAAAIEEPLQRKVEVSIGEVEPYYFTGVVIKKLSLSTRKDGQLIPVLELDKVRARFSFFSLLFGNPRVTFLVRSGKGEIGGKAKQTDDGFEIDVDVEDFDVSNIKWLETNLGLKISGRISGAVVLNVDRVRPARTNGKIDISLEDFKISASELKVAETTFPVPDVILTKGSGSRIRLNIDKGAISVDEMKLAEGDLAIDMKGKVFMSTVIANYRFNISGSFTVADKLAQAIPLLFMVQGQKQADGSYPLSITGRLSEPFIKVGTVTLPL